MSHQWLDWAKRIQSIAQAGIEFSKDVYDIERFEELRNISAEIIATYTDEKMEKIKDLFLNESGYQTPKVDIRGAIFKDNKILMVGENYDDRWSLPGGFCDIGLSPSENIIKEVKEESGFDVRLNKLLAILDSERHSHPPQPYHYYKIFVHCEIIGGEAEIGIETSDVQFFSENKLPILSLNRNTESQLKMLFEFIRNPQKEPILD